MGQRQGNFQKLIPSQLDPKSRLKLILLLHTTITKWKKQSSSSKNRYHRLKQLISTQQDYYNDLKILKQKVKQPLVNNQIISTQKANHMFNNLQNMIELSLKLRSGLIQKFHHWDQHKTVIGQYMIQFSNFFILYSDYFKNYMETEKYINQLLKNPKVKDIQKSLSTPKKIVTIQSLIAKPFQRSLKYKDILSQYLQKLDKSHPDYYHLKNATASYHMVSEKNNRQMEHKEKDTILMDLHSKYGKIIESDARFYVDQYHAKLIDVPVWVYLFSDLVLLVNQDTEKENGRVFLNKYSFAVISNNNKKYTNALYLYGNGGTIFLSFQNTLQRDNMHLILKNMIKSISENQFSREKIIAIRVSKTDNKKIYYLPDRQPQFVQPLICTVVGIQKRRISQDTINQFYVIQFKASSKNHDVKYPPQQLSLVSWQKLIKIQEFIRTYYEKDISLFSLNYVPKQIAKDNLDSQQDSRYQIRSISIQLFLNQLFREDALLKKIDIICKQLDICDPIWKYLSPQYLQNCSCQLCSLKPYYQSYDQYHYQMIKRIDSSQKKIKKCIQFCQIRTINSQLMITELPINNLQNMNKIQRISWMRARRGFINHLLTNIRPNIPFSKLIQLTVWFHNPKGSNSIVVQIHPNSKIRHIIDKVSEKLDFDLSDYTLQLHLRQNKILLNQDQIIGNIYVQQKQHGIISKIMNIFNEQNYPQSFYLRKLWVLQPKFQFGSSINKIIFQVQQIIYRLIYGQIQISIEDVYTMFACYITYSNYYDLSNFRKSTIQSKISQLTLKSNRYRQSLNSDWITTKILDLKQNYKIKKEDLLFKIISTVICKPGWSCPMFKAHQKTDLGYYIIRVRIGCDIKGIHIYNDLCIRKKYQFKHEQKFWSNQLIGEEMVIKHSQGTLYFKGREMWKLQQQIHFFQIYYRTFIAK